jgi:hypothetical protein
MHNLQNQEIYEQQARMREILIASGIHKHYVTPATTILVTRVLYRESPEAGIEFIKRIRPTWWEA